MSFQAGLPRFAAQKKCTLEDQIKLAIYGVEAPISNLQTATGVKDKVTQYWINIFLKKVQQMKADSPGCTADSIAKELQSWLDKQPGDKDYKVNQEAFQDPHANMVFHMHGLVFPEVFTLVKVVSALGSVLWVHEINNMAEYMVSEFLEHLTILIGNVLDAFGDYDPSKILLKIKYHLLPHIMEDFVRFGPAIRNSMEIFECFNAIFRLCSILSNHQSPSRDIAYKFASMDRLKHILSGGFWKQGNEWVWAASNVRDVLQTIPIIQCHLGWVPPRKLVAGKMRLAAKKKSLPLCWKETQLNLGTLVAKGLGFLHGTPTMLTGLVAIEHFLVSEQLHPDFEMPVLQRLLDIDLKIVTVLSHVMKRARTQEKRKSTIAAKALKKASMNGQVSEEPDMGTGDEDSDEGIKDNYVPRSTTASKKRPRKKPKKS
ncbi:hypothetical protein B0H10DRAFT_1937610 [Mycena sp. CBHHK59/15]|nr:hypothetical protein B0H10DRAFT_1937610 [Mycena sp. CBHHK59/15]